MDYRTNAEIGDRVRSLRAAAGLSQEQLAEVLDVDQSAVSRIEGGDRALTARELTVVADHFGVTPASIVQVEEDALALLRHGGADNVAVSGSLDEFRSCIEDYFGVEALVG